jgi:hypothetical protein
MTRSLPIVGYLSLAFLFSTLGHVRSARGFPKTFLKREAIGLPIDLGFCVDTHLIGCALLDARSARGFLAHLRYIFRVFFGWERHVKSTTKSPGRRVRCHLIWLAVVETIAGSLGFAGFDGSEHQAQSCLETGGWKSSTDRMTGHFLFPSLSPSPARALACSPSISKDPPWLYSLFSNQ